MHPPFQARSPITSFPALPGTGRFVILVQCCRALSGPSDGVLSCLNPLPTDYGLFGFRVSDFLRPSGFGFRIYRPDSTERVVHSSALTSAKQPVVPVPAAAPQVRCKRDTHAMLACCYRISFVFSSYSLRVSFVFLSLSPVGSACLPRRRCRYACALSFWLHPATFALADWQKWAILNG
jgi:hypothetical protein